MENTNRNFFCIICVVPTQVNINMNQSTFANGADVSIPCIVDGYPTPEITWYKNDQKIESNSKITISGKNKKQ